MNLYYLTIPYWVIAVLGVAVVGTGIFLYNKKMHNK